MSAWIANLRFRQKFSLLGALVLVLVGLPTVLMMRAGWQELSTLRAEQAGLQTAQLLLPLIKVTQEHRGLTGAVLAGNQAMDADRADRQRKVDQALVQLEARLPEHASSDLAAEFSKIKSQWQQIAADLAGGSLKAADSFKRHNQLVSLQLHLLGDITDVSGLALDSDPRSYYLMLALTQHLPRGIDMLGQARAKGTAIRVKGSATPDELLALRSLSDGANALFVDSALSLARAGRSFPEGRLPDNVLQAKDKAAQGLTASTELINQLVKAEGAEGPPPAEVFKNVTTAIQAQFALSDSGMQVLDEIINDRREGVQSLTFFGLLGVVVFGGLGAWVILSISHSVTHSVGQAMAVAQALSQGDLTQRLQSHQRDEVGQMIQAMGQAIDHLKGVIDGIKSASDSVATAATQIAQGNLDLSSRTEHQASSLQQTASSMEEMSAMVKQTTSTAFRSKELASHAAQEAVSSGEVFNQVVARMESIKQASSKIADINAVIDGIAFQTNILALNAAVEAARAGEQGRGFAVVASEVRSLAQRSTQAAREIKSLISQSVDSVEQGYALANSSTQSIQRLVTQVQEVSALMNDIASNTEQQSLGIEQVNQAVTTLDQGTQQNAALVEQSSAAATSLNDQAQRLQHAVATFRLA